MSKITNKQRQKAYELSLELGLIASKIEQLRKEARARVKQIPKPAKVIATRAEAYWLSGLEDYLSGEEDSIKATAQELVDFSEKFGEWEEE